MKNTTSALWIITGLWASLIYGCAQAPSSPPSFEAAEKKFVAILNKDMQVPVVTKRLANTFWIYIPFEKGIFDFRAKPDLPAGFRKAPPKYAVQFLDGDFLESAFTIEYDIIPNIKVGEDYGYTTAYLEDYYRLQNNIYGALSEAFLDVINRDGPSFSDSTTEQKEGPSLFIDSDDQRYQEDLAEHMPDFFVIITADIVKGLEMKSILYFNDFRRYRAQALPYDEYSKRYVAETRGSQKIIGDKKGDYLAFKEITWPEFLTKQIINRIRFKYQRSDFPPEDKIEDGILESVYQGTHAYDFNDFEHIKLFDVRNQQELVFDRNELKRFEEKDKKLIIKPGLSVGGTKGDRLQLNF